MFKPHNVFLIDSISKNNSFVLEQDLAMSKNKFFITVFYNNPSGEAGLAAKPIFLTWTLLTEGPAGDTDRAG